MYCIWLLCIFRISFSIECAFLIVPSHFHYQNEEEKPAKKEFLFSLKMTLIMSLVGCNSCFILERIIGRNNEKKTLSVEQWMLTINLLLLVAKEIANFTTFRFVFCVCGEKWDNFFYHLKLIIQVYSRQNLLSELTACTQNRIEAFILHIADWKSVGFKIILVQKLRQSYQSLEQMLTCALLVHVLSDIFLHCVYIALFTPQKDINKS